jgi:hypothetical protein
MISSEVQRTLVKSPPELWAELSDPASLARHLGELGDIRIVRTQPESTVEWAAENTTGTVSIKPSGWGTKVTLSVTRQLAEEASAAEAPAAHEPETIAEPEAAAEKEIASEPEIEIAAEPAVDEAPAEPAVDEAPAEPALERESRRGFFARLFARRRRVEPTATAEQTVAVAPAEQPTPEDPALTPDAFAAVRQVLAPETFATEHPFAAAPEARAVSEPTAVETTPPADAEQAGTQAAGISAELMAAEEAGAEEVTAVLTAVLDRLGAAHHRPFSRA